MVYELMFYQIDLKVLYINWNLKALDFSAKEIKQILQYFLIHYQENFTLVTTVVPDNES